MPRKRHSEERIIYALKQIEGGAKGLEMCRELGISEAYQGSDRRLTLSIVGSLLPVA